MGVVELVSGLVMGFLVGWYGRWFTLPPALPIEEIERRVKAELGASDVLVLQAVHVFAQWSGVFAEVKVAVKNSLALGSLVPTVCGQLRAARRRKEEDLKALSFARGLESRDGPISQRVPILRSRAEPECDEDAETQVFQGS